MSTVVPSSHGRVVGPTSPLEPLFLAGSVNLLAGSSGAGKTALLALIARRLQLKQSLFGAEYTREHPPYLAYIGVDKSWARSSSRWFQAEGADVRQYCIPDDRAFQKRRLRTKADRTAILHECLAKVAPDGRTFPPGSLVFVDPGALFLGGNLLDYDASAVACMEVRELCQNLGHVSLLMTVHGGKMKADKKQGYARLQDHILGSAALYGYTDTQFYLAAPDELRTKYALLQITPHHAPPQTLRLQRSTSGCFVVDESAGPAASSEPSWIVEVLASAPERTLDFAALLREAVSRDLGQKALQRLLFREIQAERVRRAGHGKYQLVLPA